MVMLPTSRSSPVQALAVLPAAFLYCDADEMAQMILAFHRASKPLRRRALAVLQKSE
jgi:hypothetical protein